jgi:hypothetical protein
MDQPFDIVPSFASSDLAEEASAESQAIALYCLLFHSRDTTLDREVGDYGLTQREILDEVFGPRLQGFAIERPTSGEPAGTRDEVYRYARLYGVGVDRLPCAVFLTALDKRKALRLPFAAFLPPKANRESDDIAMAFRAIATAADRCADVPGWHRIGSFHRSLRTARRDAYGDRIPARSRALSQVACDADSINRIATSGRNLLTLAATTAVMFGAQASTLGTATAGPGEGASGHMAASKSIGSGPHSAEHDPRGYHRTSR